MCLEQEVQDFFFPKDYNVIINGRNFFDQPVNNDIKTYDDSCLLDYPYFKKTSNKHLMLIQKQCKKLDLLKL